MVNSGEWIMNEQDGAAFELFAPVRETPIPPKLVRRLENRLSDLRSQLPRVAHATPASHLGDAPGKSRLLARVGPLVGGLLAASVLVAVLLSTKGASPAWAQVAAKVQSMNWIHFDGVTSDGAQLQYWVSLKERKLAVKWNGTVFFDDADSKVRYQFNPAKNVIERRQLGETSSLYEGFAQVFGAMEHEKNLAEQNPPEDARRVVVEQQKREVTVGGKRYLEFEFTFDDPKGEIGPSRSVYRVDPETKLPVELTKWTDLHDDTHQTLAMSYPATGPADIYALGVPKETPIVEKPRSR
jgi:hypothetical protein